MRHLLVLPVYNEESVLEKNTLKVLSHMRNLKLDFKILVVSNGSTDSTVRIAEKLAEENKEISAISTNVKGRGHAIRLGFSRFKAEVYSYIDVDLSPSLSTLTRVIREMDSCDICIASRYKKGAKTKRGLLRKIPSLCFNSIMQVLFRTSITDYQCGLKAFRRKTLPLIKSTKDDGWFFDTEILIRAQGRFHVKEVPCVWSESPRTKLGLISTILDFSWKIAALYLDTKLRRYIYK